MVPLIVQLPASSPQLVKVQPDSVHSQVPVTLNGPGSTRRAWPDGTTIPCAEAPMLYAAVAALAPSAEAKAVPNWFIWVTVPVADAGFVVVATPELSSSPPQAPKTRI